MEIRLTCDRAKDGRKRKARNLSSLRPFHNESPSRVSLSTLFGKALSNETTGMYFPELDKLMAGT